MYYQHAKYSFESTILVNILVKIFSVVLLLKDVHIHKIKSCYVAVAALKENIFPMVANNFKY